MASRTLFLLFGLPAAALAQTSAGQFRLSDVGGGTRAVETRPQPQVVVVQPAPPSRTVFRRYPSPYNPYYTPATPILVPAVVTADGRIFANFGNGYEQVYRSCAASTVVGQPPTVVAGNGVVLSSPQAPTYTQPVPNQQTASQQMLSGSRNGTVVVNSVVPGACFSQDPYGRIVVYRY